jgi:hypothetical protein
MSARVTSRSEAMFWLIWLIPILLTPVLAGVRVWYNMRQDAEQGVKG